jgi:hypothetical protein
MDHVIYAVDDLDAAASLMSDREGLASVPGGRHEGWGTANRIVPLGGSYLELITDDIDGVAKRLELEVEEKSREAEDGSTLSWRLAGLERALKTGALPFFVQWDVPPERHPGAADVRHEADARGIAWVEVRAGDRDAFDEWLGDDAKDLPVRITDGAPALAAAAIETAGGEIVLR